jgi:hypothetical protein
MGQKLFYHAIVPVGMAPVYHVFKDMPCWFVKAVFRFKTACYIPIRPFNGQRDEVHIFSPY